MVRFIRDARARLEDSLTPSLRQDLEERLPRLWARVRLEVSNGLRGHREPECGRGADLLPADLPYALDDLLADAWYPANRRGLPDDR